MHNISNINIVPYSLDLLDFASKNIIEQNKKLLPNLRPVTVFLPNNLSQTQFQNKLLAHAGKFEHSVLLLPNCITLRKWVFSNYVPSKPLLSQYARELILVDAINQQPNLFKDSNPWAIASELFTLFDEMTLNDIDLESIDDYTHKNNRTTTSKILSQEAELVTILWKAWREQLADENILDPIDAYIHALQKIDSCKDQIFYCIGLDKLSAHEIAALHKLEHQSHLYRYLSASAPTLSTKPDLAVTKLVPHSDGYKEANDISSYSAFLDSVFLNSDLSIKERAAMFSNDCPISPIETQLKIYKTSSLEQHVKAIDIKIRSHIHRGKNNIGVVTADRKLVRRLRAVLEHANVYVNDIGGWALATTSAAVVIEYWLQLIENRHSSPQLIALFKSPFFPIEVDQGLHNEAINFLEKEVVLAFNLQNGLAFIRSKLEQIHDNHDENKEPVFKYLYLLFDKLESSTLAISKLHRSKSLALHRYFDELLNSLKTMGIYSMLNKDEAGRQIIDCLETQISQFKSIENKMNWAESRRLLAKILDQQNFKPPLVKSSVTFCSLEQSRLLKFDALIIASVDKDHFPGSSIKYVFLNEHIRTELNIPTWKDEHALHFYLFRKLLEAAPDILITVQTEQNGEKITPCAWLEAIETFHAMTYGKDLADKTLESLVTQENTSVAHTPQLPLPSPTLQPAPTLNNKLKPVSISISEYQHLMNCPYQYYSSSCLNLTKTNELSEDMNKVDFGSLVHKSIHAFFSQTPSMPSPFKEKINSDTRNAAEATLRSISEIVFNKASHQKFSDDLWLQHWLNLIPQFIDWEIKRQENFTPRQHEVSMQNSITKEKILKGRVDRIDQSDNGYAIVDYKTGFTPTRKSVLAGEHVQLPMYALLTEECTQVEYVAIGKNNTVKSESVIKNESLSELINQHSMRLHEFVTSINDDAQFPALADDDICEWCEAKGLCRKDYWQS